jgi:hypothetical protein
MSDTPDKTLEKLEDMFEAVKVCRDFYEGSISVMDKDYLPLWLGESEEAYAVRVAGTAFPNMYAPIVTSLAGMVTKKEPVIEGFNSFDLTDVDLKGTNLTGFTKQLCESSIVGGIEFVAVETNENRAFFKCYKYESLVSYVVVKDKVTQMVFKEILEKPDGEYGLQEVERHIVFNIGGGEVWFDDGKGFDMQDLWENDLTEIPVVGFRTGKELSRFEVVPRLYDIAELNRVSLNFESQLANVLAVVGNPIPVFHGTISDTGVMIGVRDALVFTEGRDKEGFEYVEIDGGGVSQLQDKIKTVTEAIDKLSFSMLQKSDSRTVIDAQETQSKNTSFLTDIAVELEVKINKLYQFAAELENTALPDDAKIVFKKDFDDVLFSDSQLKLLHELVNAGQLSPETFWDKLKIANILPKDFDAEVEKERLE